MVTHRESVIGVKPNWEKMDEALGDADFAKFAEEVIFTAQQPEFKNKERQVAVEQYKLPIQSALGSAIHKIKDTLGVLYRHTVSSSRVPFSIKYPLYCLVNQDALEFDLPDMHVHPDSVLAHEVPAKVTPNLVSGVDQYTPKKLLRLQELLPNVHIQGDESIFTKEQQYAIYYAIADYGDVLQDISIEIRPADKRKIGEKTQNTMRTVTVPANHAVFRNKIDILRAIVGIRKAHERIQITWINTSKEKNIASAKNLNDLRCSLAGIYAHELAHVRQGAARTKRENIRFVLKYLLNKSWRTELEKINDAEAVMMGHGLDLYTFKMIVDANSSPQFVNKKFQEYLVPKQIVYLILYVESLCRSTYGHGYFTQDILSKARNLLVSEDWKDIDKYKFASEQ